MIYPCSAREKSATGARGLPTVTPFEFPRHLLGRVAPTKNFRQQSKAASHPDNGRRRKRSQLKTDLEFRNALNVAQTMDASPIYDHVAGNRAGNETASARLLQWYGASIGIAL
jgi:hypothetical protein